VTGTAPRTETPDPGPGRILERGRAKAYRPLSDEARRAAFRAGVEAYERGDFFEAHELWEPAWMGSADPAERALLSGLIKLAAGFVHAVRGNPAGIVTNLRGARERLATAAEAGGPDGGLDLPRLVASVDEPLHVAEALVAGGATAPGGTRRSRSPVAGIDAPDLAWRAAR
jgi:hypothetical protein